MTMIVDRLTLLRKVDFLAPLDDDDARRADRRTRASIRYAAPALASCPSSSPAPTCS